MKGLLVGYGSIGRRHLGNFYAIGVEDWAVVHTGLGTLPLEPPCPVRTYTDLHDALRAEAPTFAIVANPTSMHVSTALACVEAGCHVVLEKPVSHTLDGLGELASAVAERGVHVLVAYQFRFHPALHRMRELLRSGAIGSPLHARVTWGEYLPGWHPWEDWRLSHASRRELGGGVLHIAHPFDYLRMLFGDAVELVGSLSDAHPLELEVPEAADAVLRFADGVVATVHLDYWTRPQVHTVAVTCRDGSIDWDYISGELRAWDAVGARAWVEDVPSVEARNDLFVALTRHFLDVIDGRAEPVCTLRDGIEAVRIADAIERSSARAMEPVAPWDAAPDRP